ncbi:MULTISPECIES: O-antigen polymerase [Bacillaceae]|uniref:O-antigen polymerase n=1 Tax=Bacillaceae TaxID=186817 RepID=UPI001F5F8374|nr:MULTISPECIES: O-antigen polymerase [Bacillaceae]
MLDRLEHQEYRKIGFMYICYIMVFLPLAMVLVSKCLGFNAKKEFNEYLKSRINISGINSRDFFFIISVLSFLSVASILYTFIKLEHIPILELLKGSSDLGKLRIEASRGFKGNEYIRNIFALGLTPLLSFIAYAYSINTRSIRWRLLFIILFFLSILINVYDLQKAPVFFYFLMFILLNIYLGKFTLNIKRVSIIGIIGSFLLVCMYVFIQGVRTPAEFLSYNTGPIGRLILSQISPFFLHLDLFGNKLPFLHGKSLPNILLQLYDFEPQVRSAREVMETVYPEKVTAGIAGVLNTIFAGEAYANFGFAGIIIGTLYIGVFIQIMYISFIRIIKHPITLSIFIYFTVTIPRVMVGGFVDFVFNPFWILLIVLFLGLLVLQKMKVDFLRGFKDYLNQGKKSL